MNPVRTCIGCRQTDSQASLVRIAVRDGSIVVDDSATIPGRGAWLHSQPSCWETAIQRKAVGRALRAPGADFSALENHLRVLRISS